MNGFPALIWYYLLWNDVDNCVEIKCFICNAAHCRTAHWFWLFKNLVVALKTRLYTGRYKEKNIRFFKVYFQAEFTV